jgi:NAD-dependent deacetylase
MGSIKLNKFKSVVFFSGAGMSVESGVPTYRGRGGIWHKYNYEEYACQAAFDLDPLKVWEFHDQRRARVAKCEPNSGHKLIAELENSHPDITVVTQNIDGLHQRAGSRKVLELHGSLWQLRCDHCGVIVDNFDLPLGEYRHECGNYWRPNIVWFGDMLFPQVVRSATDAISHCDLLVSIGTSGVVYPAAEFPILAKQNGATLVEINPEETPLSPIFDLHLRGPATKMLPQLIE